MLTLNKSKKCWLFWWLWASSHYTDFQHVVIILMTLNNTIRLPLGNYPSLCSTCVTYGTPCHAIGHQLLPTHLFSMSATDLRERFLLSGIFYHTLLPAFFKASLGAGSSTSRLAGLHADLWNIAPSPAICLNHSNPQKFYAGRFYLGVMAVQLMKNLLLTGFKLFLQ